MFARIMTTVVGILLLGFISRLSIPWIYLLTPNQAYRIIWSYCDNRRVGN